MLQNNESMLDPWAFENGADARRQRCGSS